MYLLTPYSRTAHSKSLGAGGMQGFWGKRFQAFPKTADETEYNACFHPKNGI